jgi:hypothetical protein
MTAKKYWTIQRVNGNGGNGKADGIPGPHKHTLEKSDEIKKSTVQRFLAAQEKEAKKGQVSIVVAIIYLCTISLCAQHVNMELQRQMQPKKPSGNALVTAKKHSKEDQFKLYAASFWYTDIPPPGQTSADIRVVTAPSLSECGSLLKRRACHISTARRIPLNVLLIY